MKINIDRRNNTKYNKKYYRKAAFYLITVLLFLTVISTIIFTYSAYSFRDRQQVIEIRIRTMNDFINDFHNDVHRATQISATRALIGMEEHITLDQHFFSNNTQLAEKFNEVFYYGTYDGVPVLLMNNASFSDYEAKVNANARNININFYTNVTSVELSQTDPWNITVTINCTVKLFDYNNLANWDYNETFITSVSILGLRDPMYSLNTFGRIQNTIQKTNITTFALAGTAPGLNYHLENSLYKESVDAPSFLMRFYDNSSSSVAGIESMVDLELLSDQGLTVYTDRTIIDHEYFIDTATPDVCNVEDMPTWFKINSADINKYDIDELNYTACS
jgi:hypothetical protein